MYPLRSCIVDLTQMSSHEWPTFDGGDYFRESKQMDQGGGVWSRRYCRPAGRGVVEDLEDWDLYINAVKGGDLLMKSVPNLVCALGLKHV